MTIARREIFILTNHDPDCEPRNCNAQELEAFNRGDWSYIAIEVMIKEYLLSGVVVTYESTGIFGVESDSDNDYIQGLGKDQYAEIVADFPELDGLWTDNIKIIQGA